MYPTKIFLLLTVIIAFSLHIGCSSGKDISYTVSGRTVIGNNSVSGVKCTLVSEQKTIECVSGSDGSFIFDNIWNGTYLLSISKNGYIASPSTITIDVNDENVLIPSITLVPTWCASFGGSLDDRAYSVATDGSGGFVIVGSTLSKGAGSSDGYVVHIDSNGMLLWEKTFGGTAYDSLSAIIRTDDGSYIAIGTTDSTSIGGSDIWVIKIKDNGTSAALDTTFGTNGELHLGGTYDDYGTSLFLSKSGDILIAGTETSLSGADQLADFYVARINATTGAVILSGTFGDAKWDEAYSICERYDSNGLPDGIVAVGTKESSAGNRDISVMVLSVNLERTIWENTVDKGSDDEAMSAAVLPGGQIAVVGYITAANGSLDIWTGLYSHDGNLTKTIITGGTSDDVANAIIPCDDGGFVLAGYSCNTTAYRGDTDYFVNRYDASGTARWKYQYDRGASTNDYCMSISRADDSGIVFVGYSYVAMTKNDMWIIKTNGDGKCDGK